MTAIITLYRANEVCKELRPLFFEIFEFFAITAGIFNAKRKIQISRKIKV